jgi:hypothetical protein
MDVLVTPWTQEEVDKLNAYQKSNLFHPYTCPVNHKGGEESRTLVATTKGWRCPTCKYTQMWAHTMTIEIDLIESLFQGVEVYPTLDEHGYPTEATLSKIRMWDFKDLEGLMSFIESIWEYADWGWDREGNKFSISTAGWSGNESIISALSGNFIAWSIMWVSSRRGGHYEFEIPENKEKEEDNG